jgi:hypothetical protein
VRSGRAEAHCLCPHHSLFLCCARYDVIVRHCLHRRHHDHFCVFGDFTNTRTCANAGATGVTVTGGSVAAVAHGTATLLQNVRPAATAGGPATVSAMTVEDFATVEWTGFMYDLARDPVGVTEMQNLIDLCRFYKMRSVSLPPASAEATPAGSASASAPTSKVKNALVFECGRLLASFRVYNLLPSTSTSATDVDDARVRARTHTHTHARTHTQLRSHLRYCRKWLEAAHPAYRGNDSTRGVQLYRLLRSVEQVVGNASRPCWTQPHTQARVEWNVGDYVP